MVIIRESSLLEGGIPTRKYSIFFFCYDKNIGCFLCFIYINSHRKAWV